MAEMDKRITMEVENKVRALLSRAGKMPPFVGCTAEVKAEDWVMSEKAPRPLSSDGNVSDESVEADELHSDDDMVGITHE
ncbi:hypothetical protein AURDEDRAFT_166235 [Auricularia subglabra TFB-10046 SS5]|nr:hypothetical protein AURDEDRAFT_166235 [Auricularia subglabra TFB-10046 SS5]